MQQRATLSTRASLGFVTPAFILIALFLIYPFFSIVAMSFTNQSLTGAAARNPQFVGLENYANLFDFDNWMNKGEFGSSLLITAQFVFGSALIGQAGLGMFIAVLFHRRNDLLRHVVFTLAIIAWITPESVVGFAWFAFLDPFVGTLNRILGVVGLPGPDWLLDYPLLSIIFFNTWRGAAFSMLLFSSALSSIPHSYTETSQVVGASRWQQFRDILLPLLQTTIATDLILITLWTFNTFTPYLLTGGGPSFQSEVISIYTYRIGLQRFEFGAGSAVAVTVMFINLLLATIYLGISRTRKTR
jgi:multiple sugar transport system permease protein